jgi:glycosyltransferase involved in cell wall biosynthesis
LVIAGNNSSIYAKEIIEQATRKKVVDRLHLLGTVNESDKYHLYKNCKAFVFPSLAEGFGLPVVEAMSLGKPVFLSMGTSLPEIGGNEAFYFKNFDPDHMAETIKKGLQIFDADVYKADRSIKHAQQFSWKNAAAAYVKLYQTI